MQALQPITPQMYHRAKSFLLTRPGATPIRHISVPYEPDIEYGLPWDDRDTVRRVDTYWEQVFEGRHPTGWHCFNPIVCREYLAWRGAEEEEHVPYAGQE